MMWINSILLAQSVKNLINIEPEEIESVLEKEPKNGLLRRAVTSKSIRHHEWTSSESDYAKAIRYILSGQTFLIDNQINFSKCKIFYYNTSLGNSD